LTPLESHQVGLNTFEADEDLGGLLIALKAQMEGQGARVGRIRSPGSGGPSGEEAAQEFGDGCVAADWLKRR